MRPRETFLALLVAVPCCSIAASACGSSSTADAFGGAAAASGADASSAGDSGSTENDGGATNEGGTGDAGGTTDGALPGKGDAGKSDAAPVKTCDDLRAEVDALRPSAIACDPLDFIGTQCDELIEDVCCKATVNKDAKNTTAVQKFIAAVAAFKAKSCDAKCGDGACRSDPSFLCDSTGRCHQ